MRITTDRPLLLGHRGAPNLAPENTLASFRAALDTGLDGIEIDVHRTRDGVLAVHHDPNTTAGLEIAATPWEDLSEAHPELPRLDQVFELMETYDDRFLNIELKSLFTSEDGREAALARALDAWSAAAKHRTWVSCFDPRALIRLQRDEIEVPLALLVFEPSGLELPHMTPSLEIVGLHVEQSLATDDAVTDWHERGWFVFAWNVNSTERAEALVRSGLDGIIGDHPDQLLAAVERASEG